MYLQFLSRLVWSSFSGFRLLRSQLDTDQLETYITRTLNLLTEMGPWRAAVCRGKGFIQFILSSRNIHSPASELECYEMVLVNIGEDVLSHLAFRLSHKLAFTNGYLWHW